MNEPFHWTLLRYSQWLDWPLQQLYTNYSMVSKKDLKCTQNIQCLLSLLGLFLQVSYSLWFGWQFVDSTKKFTCKLVSWSWKILVSWSHEPHQNSCNVTVFNTNNQHEYEQCSLCPILSVIFLQVCICNIGVPTFADSSLPFNWYTVSLQRKGWFDCRHS